MSSAIDATKPTATNALTSDVRANFLAAKNEIEALQTGKLAQSDYNAFIAGKDASGGFPGLTLFKINFKNVANTFTSFFTNTNTAARVYTAVDRDAEIGNNLNNYSLSAQSPAAATRTYIDGSMISVPAGKLRIGTMFRWVFDITKTAAGSATSTIDVAFGTAGTTADTARVSFTKPAGTAASDTGRCVIEVIVRGPLSASGVVAGVFTMTHNLASTGHMDIPCANVVTVSGAFDVTVANLKVGLCITSGASDAITIQCVTAEAINL